MKMSDVFELPTHVGTDINDYGCLEDKNIRHITTFAQHEIEVDDSIEVLEYASHAINNHDRLTEENAKLREALESIQRMQSRTPELPDNYSHEDVGQLNDRVDEIFGKVNTTLNQLKDQNNDK